MNENVIFLEELRKKIPKTYSFEAAVFAKKILLDFETIMNQFREDPMTGGSGNLDKFEAGIKAVKKLLDQSVFDDFRKSDSFYEAVEQMDMEINAAITFIKGKKQPK
ncbi:MAG: hypothetical protein JWQ27_2323 [Ferruginibacter sp.]|nr:hypothetical protein [Ferruginibacter sp.]